MSEWVLNQSTIDYLLTNDGMQLNYITEQGVRFTQQVDKKSNSVFIRWIRKEYERELISPMQRVNAIGTGHSSPRKAPIAVQWTPSPKTVESLLEKGYTKSVIEHSIGFFVDYWLNRNEALSSWDNRFVGWVERGFTGGAGTTTISIDWLPSDETWGLLSNLGISNDLLFFFLRRFIDHWLSNPSVRSDWNTLFLDHSKRMWREHLQTLEHSRSVNEMAK